VADEIGRAAPSWSTGLGCPDEIWAGLIGVEANCPSTCWPCAALVEYLGDVVGAEIEVRCDEGGECCEKQCGVLVTHSGYVNSNISGAGEIIIVVV
jgi:hypothetical protein